MVNKLDNTKNRHISSRTCLLQRTANFSWSLYSLFTTQHNTYVIDIMKVSLELQTFSLLFYQTVCLTFVCCNVAIEIVLSHENNTLRKPWHLYLLNHLKLVLYELKFLKTTAYAVHFCLSLLYFVVILLFFTMIHVLLLGSSIVLLL